MRLRTIASSESSQGGFHSEHSIIRVYRRHAARAISEERWQVAEIFFDRILDISPDLTEAWLMKGFLRQYCRDDERSAARCYRKVLDLCRDNPSHPHAEKARASLAQLLAA
jgi:tetratricopeptide (TPR) repeat protein